MISTQYYELSADQAAQIADEVLGITRLRENMAKDLVISRADIELMRMAFL